MNKQAIIDALRTFNGQPFSANFRIRHGRGRQLRFEGRLAREVYP